MLGFIGFILVFALLVVVHEFGHYFAAKKAGVLVREFAVGFGPKIFSHRGDETTYTIRLLPAGGYVRLAGGADEVDLEAGMFVVLHTDANEVVEKIDTSHQEDHPDGLPLEVTGFDLVDDMYVEGRVPGRDGISRFQVSRVAEVVEEDGTVIQVAPRDRQVQSAKIWQQILINAAGPIMNVLLAIVLFMGFSFARGGAPTSEPIIGAVQEGSVADQAGLEEGDYIQAIDGQEMESYEDVIEYVKPRPEEDLEVQVQKPTGTSQDLTLRPAAVQDEESGESIGQIGVAFPGKKDSVGAMIASGFTQTFTFIGALIQAIWELIIDFDINRLGGPVAMFAGTSQAVQRGFADVLFLAAYLSINLAIINLLPIPALDGGKILMNIIEGIRGKPVSEKVEVTITLIGVGFLFILMILVFIKDVNVFLIN